MSDKVTKRPVVKFHAIGVTEYLLELWQEMGRNVRTTEFEKRLAQEEEEEDAWNALYASHLDIILISFLIILC